MSSTWGKNLKITIFGESHGKAIGMVAEGFPIGEKIDEEALRSFMARRSAVGKAYATPRKEPDIPVFLSGVLNGTILQSPVCIMIENTSQRSGDYDHLKEVPRPGHADFAAMMRYGENVDLRGGGHFSGRLTAPLCVAGGIAKQILERQDIKVEAKMISIGSVSGIVSVDKETGISLTDQAGKDAMMAEIKAVQAEGDSVGGVIECIISGLEAGSCGDHMFDGLESGISQVIFGIPAIKGIEFGNGFQCTKLRGSQNNDGFYVDRNSGRIKTKTNHHGGILGGIASGMPSVFRVAVKPTPSVFKEQDSVSMMNMTNEKLQIQGRHDPCIVPRAVPCVEAAAALAVLDALLER